MSSGESRGGRRIRFRTTMRNCIALRVMQQRAWQEVDEDYDWEIFWYHSLPPPPSPFLCPCGPALATFCVILPAATHALQSPPLTICFLLRPSPIYPLLGPMCTQSAPSRTSATPA